MATTKIATPAAHLHVPQSDSLPFSRPPTPNTKLALGFCGLGAMGYFMARNLANHTTSTAGSLPLMVWNRTASKSVKLREEVGEDKIRIAGSLDEIATECDIIFTNLADDHVVKSAYEQFAAALMENKPKKNKIFVETSTVYPTLAGELDNLISHILHVHLVTCPVFGAPNVADAAQLLCVMAGDYRSKKEVAHLLIPAVGRKVIDLGGNLEKASTFKLVGNSLILGSLEVLAESFTLAEKSGIPLDQVQGLIKDLMPVPWIINYGHKMTNDLFDGEHGFAIDGGIKDATHIRRLTTEMNSPMPAIDAAHRNLLTARGIHTAQALRGEHKFDTLDWSSIVVGSRVAAGLDGFDSQQHSKVVPED